VVAARRGERPGIHHREAGEEPYAEAVPVGLGTQPGFTAPGVSADVRGRGDSLGVDRLGDPDRLGDRVSISNDEVGSPPPQRFAQIAQALAEEAVPVR
jgi:hypothetical protein